LALKLSEAFLAVSRNHIHIAAIYNLYIFEGVHIPIQVVATEEQGEAPDFLRASASSAVPKGSGAVERHADDQDGSV